MRRLIKNNDVRDSLQRTILPRLHVDVFVERRRNEFAVQVIVLRERFFIRNVGLTKIPSIKAIALPTHPRRILAERSERRATDGRDTNVGSVGFGVIDTVHTHVSEAR